MLTVIEGIPAPLLVPRPMLSTGPAVNDPVMGEVPAIATEIIGQAPVTNGEAQLPPGLTFTQIIVNGNIYVWADSPETVSLPGNLAITNDGYTTSNTNGTFWYDYETGVVTLPTAIPNNVTVAAYRPITPYRTDKISTIPVALRDAVGQISIQYSLFSPPSVSSVTFLCRRNQISSTLSRFSATSPVNIDGHKYYPTQKSVVDSPVENKAAIAVGFESQFRNNPPRTELDRAIKIKPLLNKSVQNDNESTYSLRDVASRSGIALHGINFEVRVAKNIDSSTSVTLRQLLSAERLMSKQCFLRLDKDTVEIAAWKNVFSHVIQLSELKGGDSAIPPVNYNGSGTTVNGVPLLVELRKAELQLDKEIEEAPIDIEETRISGDLNPSSAPQITSDQKRSMSTVFDNGGPTKKRITTKLLNGSPTEEIEEHFGFIYISKDIYSYRTQTIGGKQQADVFFAPSAFGGLPWDIFKKITKRYIYNRQGYLEKIISTVRTKQRILKESNQLESIVAEAELAVNPLTSSVKSNYESHERWFKSRGLYSFNPVSTSFPTHPFLDNDQVRNQLNISLIFNPNQVYTTTEERKLVPMSKYYDDIESPDEDEDPEWVEPLFIEERTISEDGVMLVADPRVSQKKKNPPIIFGKQSTQVETIEILSRKDPERFKVTQKVTNREGENLEETVTDTQFSIQNGRPSQAERLIVHGKKIKKQKDEDKATEKYLVTTIGLQSQRGDGISQSLSFPGVYTLNEGYDAIKTWLLIQNLDAATTTLSLTKERKSFRVGDKVNYNGKNWRIKSIRNVKERDRQIEFTVELGFDFGNIPFTIEIAKQKSKNVFDLIST